VTAPVPPTAGPSPAEPLSLNPGVPHPPFPWLIDIPSTWSLLDTNPASWQRSASRLVDERFAGRSLKAAERRAVRDFLEQLVADCQRADATLSLIQLGRMSTGAIGSAGLHLAWFNSRTEPASLALVRQTLPRSGIIEEIDTPSGPGLLHTDQASIVPPGATTRVRSQVWQFFLPLPASTWTALLSAASPHPEMAAMLHELIVGVARSIRRADEAGDSAESPQRPDAGDDPFDSAPTTGGPGIEKGFGTMLRRRVEGDGSTRPGPPDG
jgi:hypothetical protein